MKTLLLMAGSVQGDRNGDRGPCSAPQEVLAATLRARGHVVTYSGPDVELDAVVAQGELLLLAPGDRLVLYSDGITEAFSPEDQSFGLDRLRQCLLRHRQETLHCAVGHVLEEVLAWSAGQPHDDLSVLAVAVE